MHLLNMQYFKEVSSKLIYEDFFDSLTVHPEYLAVPKSGQELEMKVLS